MKKLMIAVTFFALVLMLAPMASAQLNDRTWKADIPYGFQVENQKMPAGVYLVKWVSGRIQLASEDGKNVASLVTFPVVNAKTQERSYLKFNNYAGKRFLAAIYFAGVEQSREVLQSKEAMQLAKTQTATPEYVVGSR